MSFHGSNYKELFNARRFKAPTEAGAPEAAPEAVPTVDTPIPASRFGHLFDSPEPPYEPTDEGLTLLSETMRETFDRESDSNAPNEEHDYPGLPIGFAFLGQFIDHDITFDPVSRLNVNVSGRNFRSPSLDLDSVYGSGPDASRHLYDVQDELSQGGRLPVRLLIPPTRTWDLPRNEQRTAVIGDPRNDENHFISQVHRRFLGFHNAVVSHLVAEKKCHINPKDLFEEARKIVTQHYHGVIRDDFLPRIVRKDVLEAVLASDKPQVFRWSEKGDGSFFMPVEFAVAAYRFGHTMIRTRYRLNVDEFRGPRDVNLFDLSPFDQRTAADALDWHLFVGDAGQAQFARKIDAKVSKELFDLPFISRKDDPPPSLPLRNLQRSRDVGLPSGQDVAAQIAALVTSGPKPTPLSNADLGIGEIEGLGDQAPLWFYILKESGLQEEGRTLGLVGSWLVAEVLVELMRRVKDSPLNVDWKPSLVNRDVFTFHDLVCFSE